MRESTRLLPKVINILACGNATATFIHEFANILARYSELCMLKVEIIQG